jgi:hypothetical protein
MTEHNQVIESATDANCAELLAAVRNLGAPYHAELPQGRTIESTNGCFVGPQDPREAAVRLGEQFPEQRLLAAGLCIREADGQLLLTPQLTSTAGPLIALEAGTPSKLFAIISGGAAFPNTLWAAIAPFDDAATARMALGFAGDVLWVPAADAAWWRTLGYPAAPVGDPTTCPFATVEVPDRLVEAQNRLTKRMTLLRRKKVREPIGTWAWGPMPDAWEPTVIVASWSPLGWDDEKQEQLSRCVQFFAGLRTSFPGFALSLGVWLPTAADRQQLDLLAQAGDQKRLRARIVESLHTSVFDPRRALEFGLTHPVPPATVADARAAAPKLRVAIASGDLDDAQLHGLLAEHREGCKELVRQAKAFAFLRRRL